MLLNEFPKEIKGKTLVCKIDNQVLEACETWFKCVQEKKKTVSINFLKLLMFLFRESRKQCSLKYVATYEVGELSFTGITKFRAIYNSTRLFFRVLGQCLEKILKSRSL